MGVVAPQYEADSEVGGAFNHALTQTGAGTSDTVIVPIGMDLGVKAALLLVAAGTAKLQVSYSPREAVRAGTATFIDWTAGAVTATTIADLSLVTAVKAVVTSGTWTLELNGD